MARVRRTALVALALGALILGVAIAQADSSSATSGGLSVTPAVIDRPATLGPAGTVTLANTTKAALKITVMPRPWLQSPGGAVTPNRRLSLSPQIVVVDPNTFVLPAGASRSVTINVNQVPAGGSVYGSIEAIGVPVDAAKHKGVSVGYRLISNLRLNPANAAARKYTLAVKAPKVQGASVVLPVRNTGNTIEPITGTAKISSSLGARTVTIASQRIVPAATVNLPLTALKGLARGHYTVAYSLSQAGHVVSKATGKFVVGP